jgi:hypothetical protein
MSQFEFAEDLGVGMTQAKIGVTAWFVVLMTGITTGVTIVDKVGTLNVRIAVLTGTCDVEVEVVAEEEEGATTTRKSQGVEIASGRPWGIVIVVLGVQTDEEDDEEDLIMTLRPQGIEIPVGRLIGIVIVVEGVHKVLVEEDAVTILTKQGVEKPEGSWDGIVIVVVGVHSFVTLTSHLGTTPEGKSKGKVIVVVGVQILLLLLLLLLQLAVVVAVIGW